MTNPTREYPDFRDKKILADVLMRYWPTNHYTLVRPEAEEMAEKFIGEQLDFQQRNER